MTAPTPPAIRGWRHYDDTPVEPSQTPAGPAPFAWYFQMWPMNGTPNDVTIPVVGGITLVALGVGLGGEALHYGASVLGICLGAAMSLPGIGLLLMARARLRWHRRNPDINPGSYVPTKPPMGRRRPVLVKILDACLVAACLVLGFLFGFTAFSVGFDPTPTRARASVVVVTAALCVIVALVGVFAVRRLLRRSTRRRPA